MLFAPLIVCSLALLLDRVLGEPRRLHPLVGFGRVVSAVEKSCNTHPTRPWQSLLAGVAALLDVTLPILGVTIWMSTALEGLWLILA